MNRTIEILEVPVLGWARWLGVTGGVAGFLVGLFSLIMLFISPEGYPSSGVPRLMFGYAAPITFAVIWAAFGAFGGAMFASTYNHMASIFGGLTIKCEVPDVDESEA